jgi:acyl transferase domain-containing protein
LKSILILKHGQIPANLNFIKPKPSLKLYEKKIKVEALRREIILKTL